MYSLRANQPLNGGPTWSDAPVQDVEIVPVHQAVHALCAPGPRHTAQVPLLGRGQLGVLEEEEGGVSSVTICLYVEYVKYCLFHRLFSNVCSYEL